MKLNDVLDAATHDIRSLLIVRDCKLVFERYKDGIGREHNHTIYSVTKSITATLVGALLAQGKLKSVNVTISELISKPCAFDLPTIHRMGIVAAAREATEHLCREELDGFWIHVDADCLEDAVMPAVDFRLPGGLLPEQLETVLTMALDSGSAVGLEITIYNPALDADGQAGKLLTDLLVSALSKSRTRSSHPAH